MQGVIEFLIVWNAFVVTHVEAAVVAEDARSDIIQIIVHQLGDPFIVSQELSGKTRAVDLSFLDRLCCRFRIHPACCYHRDAAVFFDVFHVFQVAVLRHVDRRMCPVPGIIGAVVAVEHVVSRFFQEFHRFFRFLHVSADFDVFLARQSAFTEIFRLGYDGIPQGYREVFPAFLLDRFYDLSGKTVTVFQRSAVFVLSFVHIFQSELIQQISFMHGMDLYSVNTRILQFFRRFCESIDEFLYFRFGHFP